MTLIEVQAFAVLLATGFCLIRGIIDLTNRRRASGFATLAFGGGLFVLLVCTAVTPVQTHAVKVDLPQLEP